MVTWAFLFRKFYRGYNDTIIYVDDSPLDEKETGIIIKDNQEELEKTAEYNFDDINPFDYNELEENDNE